MGILPIASPVVWGILQNLLWNNIIYFLSFSCLSPTTVNYIIKRNFQIVEKEEWAGKQAKWPNFVLIQLGTKHPWQSLAQHIPGSLWHKTSLVVFGTKYPLQALAQNIPCRLWHKTSLAGFGKKHTLQALAQNIPCRLWQKT